MSESTTGREALRAWLVSGSPPMPSSTAHARALADAALTQGLGGLLDDDVRADARWPADVRATLREARRALLRRGCRQLDLAERARRTLEGRGLRALPMKGAALCERLYASPADRPMADVDLLALDDWDAARRALEAEGFEPGERADHAWALRDPHSGLAVELHRGLTSCPRLHAVDAEGLWTRSVAAPGQVSRRPSSEDLLVQLALHAAFQHGLVLSLVQWLDLRRLLEREELDLARAAACARAAHAEAALGLTLAAARAVVAAPVHDAWRDVARVPERLARRLATRAARPLDFVSPARPDLARLRWELAAGRRRVLLADTLRPSTGDVPGTPAWRRLARAGRLAWRWLVPWGASSRA